MRADISFTWWRERNPRDYVEIEAEAFRNRPSFVDVVLKGRQPRIVAKGICLERYHPLEEFPDLYERFAKLRSKDGAVKFIRTLAHLPMTACGAARAIAFIRYCAKPRAWLLAISISV